MCAKFLSEAQRRHTQEKANERDRAKSKKDKWLSPNKLMRRVFLAFVQDSLVNNAKQQAGGTKRAVAIRRLRFYLSSPRGKTQCVFLLWCAVAVFLLLIGLLKACGETRFCLRPQHAMRHCFLPENANLFLKHTHSSLVRADKMRIEQNSNRQILYNFKTNYFIKFDFNAKKKTVEQFLHVIITFINVMIIIIFTIITTTYVLILIKI